MKKVLLISHNNFWKNSTGGEKAVYGHYILLSRYFSLTTLSIEFVNDNSRVEEVSKNNFVYCEKNSLSKKIKAALLSFFSHSSKFVSKLERKKVYNLISLLVKQSPDIVVLEGLFIVELGEFIKKSGYKGKIACWQHNAEYSVCRELANYSNGINKLLYLIEARNFENLEKISATYIDVFLYLSSVDYEFAPLVVKNKSFITGPHFLYDSKHEVSKSVVGKNLLLPLNQGYYPNIDGLIWFYNEYKNYINSNPDSLLKAYNFYISGIYNIPKEINEIPRNWIFVGFLEQNQFDALFETISCIVVPLRIGSGIKYKILDALAHGKPVLGTKKALEGFNNKLEVLREWNDLKEMEEILTSDFNINRYELLSKLSLEVFQSNFNSKTLDPRETLWFQWMTSE